MIKTRLWFPLLAVGGFLSLPLALFAQWQLDKRIGGGRVGWLLLGTATLLFLGGFVRWSAGGGQPVQSMRSDRPWGPIPAVVGVVASLGSYAFFGGNRLTLIGLLLWQGGLVVFIGGAAGWGSFWDLLSEQRRRWRSYSIHLSPTLVGLVLLTIVGAFFRLWNIAALPAEPGVDLPLILMNVEKVLDGEWPIFFTIHPGREGLYIYLAAGYVKLFGLGYPALRTLGALLGTATIPVLYLLGRQLFDNEVGLVAAGFLAFSRWHIILSRTGLRFILMPLFSLLLLAALDRALKSRRPLHWAAVGLVLGWGFHTYNAWVIMPAVVVCGWLAHQAVVRDWSRSAFSGLMLALVLAVILLVPLARFAHDDPGIFSLRIVSRISVREQPLPVDLAQIIWDNIMRTAQMFNFTGDGVAHINVPLKRQLGLISGAFFLPGVFYLLTRWRQSALLFLALIITSLPSALALAFPGEVPNAGRSSGAVGLACLVAAVPLVLWRRQWQFAPGRWMGWRPLRIVSQVALVIAVLASLVIEGGETRVDYFERYKLAQPGGNYPVSTRLVEIIEQFGSSGQVYLKAYPHWYDGNALRTQLRLAGIEWDNELVEIRADPPPQSDRSGPIVVVLDPRDTESLNALRIAFPHAVEFTHYDNHSEPVLITFVERGTNAIDRK